MQREPPVAPPCCALCGRPLVPGPSVNEHHLVPRSRKGKDKILLHRICHNAIHAALDERALAAHYHTVERLVEHPAIRRFVAWVQSRPPEFHAPTHGRARRR